ncbi:MAG: hypothetical protein WCR21_01260 [Bacteroidota bacterium]
MKKFARILSFLLLLCLQSAWAQQVRVEAVLDTARIRIGEQAKLNLYLTYDSKLKGLKIEWPSIGDTLSEKVEVVNVSPIDTTLPEKSNSSNVYQHQQITVSVYDSGFFAIPPFKFLINNDTLHPLYTEPLFLEVHTVPTDSSATKLKDIKPPYEEKFNWRWYMSYVYWVIGALLLIIIIVLITLYLSKKPKPIEQEPAKPKVPPHLLALENLQKIQQEQIWKDGKSKEYYSAISDTIRLYIEERFAVNALESTTDEIMLAFRSQVVDKDSKEKLQQLLMLSDLVKFAKLSPIESENAFTLQNAFDFVNATKREEIIEDKQNEETNTNNQ